MPQMPHGSYGPEKNCNTKDACLCRACVCVCVCMCWEAFPQMAQLPPSPPFPYPQKQTTTTTTTKHYTIQQHDDGMKVNNIPGRHTTG